MLGILGLYFWRILKRLSLVAMALVKYSRVENGIGFGDGVAMGDLVGGGIWEEVAGCDWEMGK